MARKSERRRSTLRVQRREVIDVEMAMVAGEVVEMLVSKSVECALLKLHSAFLVAVAERL